MIILKNPDNGAAISHVVNKSEYKIAVGETVPFTDEVGTVLKGIYGFLEEVPLPQDKLGRFKCPYCEFTSEVQVGVLGHMRSHKDKPQAPVEKVTEETKVEPAKGRPVVSLEEQRKKEQEEVYADSEIPQGNATDKDGVEWVGEGLEKDTGR